MEMRNVKAGEQVLRNLSSRERRELATSSKHRMRDVFRNWPILKGVIVRCRIGDEATDPTRRVRTDGLFQGIVSGWLFLFARNSNLVMNGASFATVSLVLLSHGSTAVGARVIFWKSFFWEL